MMKKQLLLVPVLFVLMSTFVWAGSTRVIVLESPFTRKAEIDSLYSLLARKGHNVEVVDITAIQPRALQHVSVVVYHRSDSAAISAQEAALKKLLLQYVNAGGSLMLTMDAVQLLNKWKIEPETLQVEYQPAIDEGYGRAVGFHGYRDHPLFAGLFGGAYTWKATVDNTARTIGFSDTKVPKAKDARVIGINWTYIHYHEKRKLVWEMPYGKGKILAIGGYLYFSRPNVNREVCEIFVDNSIGYLSGKTFNVTENYWQYDTVNTKRVAYESLNISIQPEARWTPAQSKMAASREGAKDHYWNVSGQQILVMGKEPGGIDEIWIHPIMALRDFAVGVKYRNSNEIVWLNELSPVVTKSPGAFERNYKLRDGSQLREYFVADLKDPLMAVRFDWDPKHIERIVVSHISNLRLMWPYSLESTGTLFYSHSEDGKITTVYDRQKKLNMVTAFDKSPLKYRSGEYDFKGKDPEKFEEVKAKHKQVSFLYEFSGDWGSLNFYLSGGEMGLTASAQLIQRRMGRVADLDAEVSNYYASFDRNLLSIESSDTLFNNAYRWALISTDKFYCHTPSLGSSLMSGYFTTARGWNGGQKVSGRPGYAWYFGRDTELTGLALSALGDYEKVRAVLETFGKYQAPEGKIYHELTTSGSVHYDASDATPLYVALAGYYLKRSGDIDFIRKEWDKIVKAMNFCYSTDTDGDLLIENTNVGHGWQEGWELYGAHTEVYLAACWAAALREAGFMAGMLGDRELKNRYQRDMKAVVEKINKNFWNERLGFYNHGLMRDGSYQEEKCVLGGTPIFFDLAESAKALKTAENFSSKYYSTDWGVRMVGYNSRYYAIGGYKYGNIWPLFTGMAALEEYKAGLPMQGYRHVLGNLKNYIYWDYGNLPEVIAGDELKFSGICTHQQWSTSMSIFALTDGMLGLTANALSNSLTMSPAFPVDWEFADVKNIYVGKKAVHLSYRRSAEGYRYMFEADSSDAILLHFAAVLPLGTEVISVKLNGEEVAFTARPMVQSVRVDIASVKLGEKDVIEIRTRGGVGVYHNLKQLELNEKDVHIKIEKERFDTRTRTYELFLAGLPGSTYEVEVFVRPAVKSIEGARLKERKGEKAVYIVSFPEGAEPFVNKVVRMGI